MRCEIQFVRYNQRCRLSASKMAHTCWGHHTLTAARCRRKGHAMHKAFSSCCPSAMHRINIFVGQMSLSSLVYHIAHVKSMIYSHFVTLQIHEISPVLMSHQRTHVAKDLIRQPRTTVRGCILCAPLESAQLRFLAFLGFASVGYGDPLDGF